MSNYILFSPVGGHDPISNYRDGALLHIARTYRPSQVYVYLSQEMIERTEADDRYLESLRRLQDHLDFAIEEIVEIRRPELTEVQLFDTFYYDFETIISDIREKNPGCELLLNVSSGTPAMKSALEFIAAMSGEHITAVQVSTPVKRENKKDDDPHAYDLDLFWEMNEDNAEGYENRCAVVKSINLEARVKIQAIKKLIASYDYHAALTLAKEMEACLPERAVRMIEAAACRYQLDLSGYGKIANKWGFDFLPVKDSSQRAVFEYLLNLDIKLKKKEYADFIRALTPVILDVFDMYLINNFGINFKEQYCEPKGRNRALYPSLAKLNGDANGRRIKAALLANWGGDEARLEAGFYGSKHLLPIIQEFDRGSDVAARCEILRRDVEEQLRNATAHEILSVTEDVIQKRTGMSPAKIMEHLKFVYERSRTSAKKEYWKSYDTMNEAIVEELFIASE